MRRNETQHNEIAILTMALLPLSCVATLFFRYAFCTLLPQLNCNTTPPDPLNNALCAAGLSLFATAVLARLGALNTPTQTPADPSRPKP